jgi:DNA helicase-2/ATP-dependent DNA helicase PcrA
VRQSLGEIPGLAEVFVGTMHAVALELLKSEARKYLKFEVLSEIQQNLFVARNSCREGIFCRTHQ